MAGILGASAVVSTTTSGSKVAAIREAVGPMPCPLVVPRCSRSSAAASPTSGISSLVSGHVSTAHSPCRRSSPHSGRSVAVILVLATGETALTVTP